MLSIFLKLLRIPCVGPMSLCLNNNDCNCDYLLEHFIAPRFMTYCSLCIGSTSSLTTVATPSHINDNTCLVCDDQGTEDDELIGCSSCANAFHQNCHNPPLRAAHRRGVWMCSVCRVGRASSGSLSVTGQLLRPRNNNRMNRKGR